MTTRRILDCFPLGYETDVLLLRMQTLSDVVDKFVIVEGDRTFAGRPRAALWPMLAERPEFKPFLDRVHWGWESLSERPAVANDGNYAGDAWGRERELRGALLPLADDAGVRPRDIVIVGDADEIPHPDAVRAAAGFASTSARLIRLPGYYHQLRLDLRATGSQLGTMAGVPGLAGYTWEFRQPLLGQHQLFHHAHDDRAARQTFAQHLDVPMGWHMTCMGSDDEIVSKLQAYSHREFDHYTPETIRDHVENRYTIGHNVPLHRVFLSELPPPVQADPERWMHMLAYGER